jgi:hypothetical protein
MTGVARTEVREYIVTAWPEGPEFADEAWLWEISVHRTRIPGMWAVTQRSSDLPIMTKKGNWSWTMPRSLRSSCYMPLDQAMALALEAAPKVTINGWTLEDAIAKVAPRKEA